MGEQSTDPWLVRFHAGERPVMAEVYASSFSAVSRAVGAVLRGADAETVVHEVYYRLLSRPEVRAGFRGGSLQAWLCTLARNLALDHTRRARREVHGAHLPEPAETPHTEEQLAAHQLVSRFQREVLPAEWAGVFRERFLLQKSQREAASALGIERTTLAYRELRIRRMLERFLLEAE